MKDILFFKDFSRSLRGPARKPTITCSCSSEEKRRLALQKKIWTACQGALVHPRAAERTCESMLMHEALSLIMRQI